MNLISILIFNHGPNYIRTSYWQTMEQTLDGVKVESGQVTPVNDILAVEAPLQININFMPYTVIMRTPMHDIDLVRGLMFTEQILDDVADLEMDIIQVDEEGRPRGIKLSADPTVINKAIANDRHLIVASSCGICGKTSIDEIETDGAALQWNGHMSIDTVHAAYRKMNASQSLFKQSGGSHAAAAFNRSGDLLVIREDIGRHNAVDKVVGNLISTGRLDDAKLMLVSGRLSYEIVQKTWRAGIPVLAAVSSPSSLAVEMARNVGMTLIGFTREPKATIYAHPQRITETESVHV